MEKSAKNQVITEVSKVMENSRYYQNQDSRQDAIAWALENLDSNLDRLEISRRIKNKYKSEQFKKTSAQKTADREELQSVISAQFENGSMDNHLVNLFNLAFHNEKIRMITFAYIFKGLNQADISKEFGLTINQVRYCIKQGFKICRNNLELLHYLKFKIDKSQCIRYRKALKNREKTPVYSGIHYKKNQIKSVIKKMNAEAVVWSKKQEEKKACDLEYYNRLDSQAIMYATRDKLMSA